MSSEMVWPNTHTFCHGAEHHRVTLQQTHKSNWPAIFLRVLQLSQSLKHAILHLTQTHHWTTLVVGASRPWHQSLQTLFQQSSFAHSTRTSHELRFSSSDLDIRYHFGQAVNSGNYLLLSHVRSIVKAQQLSIASLLEGRKSQCPVSLKSMFHMHVARC